MAQSSENLKNFKKESEIANIIEHRAAYWKGSVVRWWTAVQWIVWLKPVVSSRWALKTHWNMEQMINFLAVSILRVIVEAWAFHWEFGWAVRISSISQLTENFKENFSLKNLSLGNSYRTLRLNESFDPPKSPAKGPAMIKPHKSARWSALAPFERTSRYHFFQSSNNRK